MARSPTQQNPRQDPAGTPVRRAALAILQGVLWRGQPLEIALDRAVRDLAEPRDRALAHAISAAVLRHLVDLDARIDSATAKALPSDARARLVLRLALAQALVLATPAHAVVSTALPLVEAGPRRLVHGVLSRLLKAPAPLPDPPSLPPAIAAGWRAAYGADAVDAIARVLAQTPPLDLTLKSADDTAHWAAVLGGDSWLPGHVRLPMPSGGVTALPGYADGAWWVQDIAASLPARMLNVQPGELVLDLCAAPGGKTLQLAATGARVIAVDASPHRLQRVEENLARTGLQATCVGARLEQYKPPALADAILLDAPCSATGTARRHPDVLHHRAGGSLAEITAQQSALLERALTWLKPGGRLVYAVCSLEPAEGEAIIEAALLRDPQLRRAPAPPLLPGLFTEQGDLRSLPSAFAERGGVDGFYAAMITRAA
jgi:16S rRNA (cytosine967-C5)-methyltransferase